jgi:hypothetical protein
VGQLRRGCQRCRAALPGTAAERCAITMLFFFIFQLFDLSVTSHTNIRTNTYTID